MYTHKQMATKLVQKGRKKENRMGADGFVDCSQRGADLHRSKALSTAHPSGHRALPGDGGVCEVYDHSSSKGGGGKEPWKAAVSKGWRSKSWASHVLQLNQRALFVFNSSSQRGDSSKSRPKEITSRWRLPKVPKADGWTSGCQSLRFRRAGRSPHIKMDLKSKSKLF